MKTGASSRAAYVRTQGGLWAKKQFYVGHGHGGKWEIVTYIKKEKENTCEKARALASTGQSVHRTPMSEIGEPGFIC